MFLEREGRIDPETGCALDEGVLYAFENPRRDAYYEKLGSYTIALPQLLTQYHIAKQIKTEPEKEADLYFPSTVTRRGIGEIIHKTARVPVIVVTGYIVVNKFLDYL
jgi:hypothetical protein